MIYLTGDTHGMIDFDKLPKFFESRPIVEGDVLIILGDCGVLWNEVDNYTEAYSSLGLPVLFIDGNHENFEMLNALPIVEKFGAKMHQVSKNVFHILRGEYLNIHGVTFLCMGGATSTDKILRKDRITWWSEENISYRDVDNAVEHLKEHDFEVDYVLSHCAPSSVVERMFSLPHDQNTAALESIKKETNFMKWFFGHYHKDVTHGDYRCFYNDIYALKTDDDIETREYVYENPVL